jgi:membrane associated rhomboid family serine protease
MTNYYSLPPLPAQRHTDEVASFKDPHAVEMSYQPSYDHTYQGYENGHYNEISRKPLIEQQPEAHRKDPPSFLKKVDNLMLFTYAVTIADIAVFIYELVKMQKLTGSAFQTKPYFNPMLGPSTYVQIYIGSRFQPCMLPDQYASWNVDWPCPNSTTTDTQVCSLYELCGLPEGVVDSIQNWRLLSACFLHAGFIHIIFNLLLQLTIGREVEKFIGTLRYMAIYLLSGVSGNLFGINFAGNGVSSCGASGALFGVIAVNLIIYLLHMNKRRIRYYGCLVGILIFEIVTCLVLGLLPGLDNFAHIGGFVCGGLLGVILLDNPRFVKMRPSKKFTLLKSSENYIWKRFWIWTGARVVCLGLLIAWFVGLGLNYQNGAGNCSWCRYLSCLPVNGWCDATELRTS